MKKNTILVPTDFSEVADHALEHAIHVAKTFNNDIALLHVTDGLVQKGGDRAIFGGFWAAKDDPSTQLLDIQQLRRGFTSSALLSAEISKADFIFSNNFFSVTKGN